VNRALAELRSRGMACALCGQHGRGKRVSVKGLGFVHPACLAALEAGALPPRGEREGGDPHDNPVADRTASGHVSSPSPAEASGEGETCWVCGGRGTVGPDNPVGPFGEDGEEPCPVCAGGDVTKWPKTVLGAPPRKEADMPRAGAYTHEKAPRGGKVGKGAERTEAAPYTAATRKPRSKSGRQVIARGGEEHGPLD